MMCLEIKHNLSCRREDCLWVHVAQWIENSADTCRVRGLVPMGATHA